MTSWAADLEGSTRTASLLFAGVAPATRRTLDAASVLRRFAPGEPLFRQGDLPTHLFLVVGGRVKVWRALREGGALTLTFLAQGAPLGTLGAVRDTPHTATATAQSATEAILCPIDIIRQSMLADGALTANLLLIVTNYAEQMIDRLEEMSTVPVEQRLARTLLRLGRNPWGGEVASDEVLPLSRQDLADLTSTTLPTVSRIMSRWRQSAVVDGGRSRVVVKDRARLLAMADLPEDWQRPLQSALAILA